MIIKINYQNMMKNIKVYLIFLKNVLNNFMMMKKLKIIEILILNLIQLKNVILLFFQKKNNLVY